MSDSSEIATTHVLRAPASIAHVSACYLLHTGRRLASERAGNLPDSPISGRCKVLQSGASIPATFPSPVGRPRQA